MMSAAVPWIGMLIAIRSPAALSARFADRSSGICRLRPEQRGHVALLPRRLADVEHVAADPAVGREVGVDELLRVLAADPGPARQPEVAHPVGEPEVDHLGHRPLVGGDVLGRLAEHPGGGLAVDVGLALERVAEVLVAAHVGEDPELDLAVVGGDQRRVRRAGDERVADAPAERRPDRDVLEVGVGARQAARSPRRPGGTACGAARRARSASAAPRRRSSAAWCRSASRGRAR